MAKAKAFQLRQSSVEELKTKIQQYKEELHSLRVGFVPRTHEGRVGKIQTARKNIARSLSVYNEKRREEAKAAYKGKKWIPKEMRPKLTRALRRALTPEQKAKKTLREVKRNQNFAPRKFVVLA